MFYWINEYISLKYSNYDNNLNEWVLKTTYINDICKLNNIIGKLEIYIIDRKDKENAVYMVEWFKKEMDSRDYIYEDFIEWAEEKENIKQTENE